MSAQHTPGRIRYDFEPGYCGELIASNGTTVATFTDEPSKADAKRLVACWNACDGISTELLEAAPYKDSAAFMAFLKVEGQRDELLDSIKNFFDVYENREKKPGWVVRVHDARARCMEAIQKATGGAA